MFIKRDVHSFTVYIWDIDDQFSRCIMRYIQIIFLRHQSELTLWHLEVTIVASMSSIHVIEFITS